MATKKNAPKKTAPKTPKTAYQDRHTAVYTAEGSLDLAKINMLMYGLALDSIERVEAWLGWIVDDLRKAGAKCGGKAVTEWTHIQTAAIARKGAHPKACNGVYDVGGTVKSLAGRGDAGLIAGWLNTWKLPYSTQKAIIMAYASAYREDPATSANEITERMKTLRAAWEKHAAKATKANEDAWKEKAQACNRDGKTPPRKPSAVRWESAPKYVARGKDCDDMKRLARGESVSVHAEKRSPGTGSTRITPETIRAALIECYGTIPDVALDSIMQYAATCASITAAKASCKPLVAAVNGSLAAAKDTAPREQCATLAETAA